MGFTKTTEQVTIHKIQGDGLGGFWWIGLNAGGTVIRKAGYLDNDTIKQSNPLEGFGSFWDLTSYMITNNVGLPANDTGIKCDRAAGQNNITSEFQNASISNANLAIMAQTWPPVEYSKKMGLMLIPRRYYVKNHITWIECSEIFIYLGLNNKIAVGRVETSMNWLLNNSHITQQQHDDFWIDWAAQVGT